MARLPRFCPTGLPQHIIQRGNNRGACFADQRDFAAYANWLKEYSEKFDVAVHAWIFMTNHVHLLVTPSTDDGVSLMMQSLGRRYVQYFNYSYRRSGTLWEGRFKSSVVQSRHYLLACYRYIELNPVRAGMVDYPFEYVWSSYHCNALGLSSSLCSPHVEYLALSKIREKRLTAYRALFNNSADSKWVIDISNSINKGLALGSKHFKEEVEQLYGRRVQPAAMGRPKTKCCT